MASGIRRNPAGGVDALDGGLELPGIVHPLRTDAAVATLSLAQGAVTTSGGYERFVEIEGRRYSHLIDPRNGWPVDGLLSVSVVASQAVAAGSIATVALLQPQVDGLNWLERCGVRYLAVDPELRCYGHFATPLACLS